MQQIWDFIKQKNEGKLLGNNCIIGWRASNTDGVGDGRLR